jgi:hypothetical protein
LALLPSTASTNYRHIKDGGERRNAFYLLGFFQVAEGKFEKKG